MVCHAIPLTRSLSITGESFTKYSSTMLYKISMPRSDSKKEGSKGEGKGERQGGEGDRDRERNREGDIDTTALYGIGQRLVLVCKMEIHDSQTAACASFSLLCSMTKQLDA